MNYANLVTNKTARLPGDLALPTRKLDAIVLAIDPGTTESAWVLYSARSREVCRHAKQSNEDVADMLRQSPLSEIVVLEMVASYGKPVGQEVFDTCVWLGVFMECARGRVREKMFRRDVKRILCGTDLKVNDAVIRQRLIDMFGPGKEQAIGTKRAPGPLYGIKADEWQALALAVAFQERFDRREAK